MNLQFKQLLARLLSLLVVLFLGFSSVQAQVVTGKTSAEIAAMMTTGWNLGNTFDANGGETSWGQPKTTQAMIDMIKEAGFNTIRIPVSWAQHVSNNGTYTNAISTSFIARVKEVVNYCYNNNMFVILNIHHDNNGDGNSKKGFSPSSEWKDKSITYVGDIWAQVAAEFADYDQHLIFETLNEPRLIGDANEWWFSASNPPTKVKDAIDVINQLNQTAVNAIRSNGGGYNSERVIMVPGYAASLEGCTTPYFQIPTDAGGETDRIAISLHAYTPSSLCLAGAQTEFTSGAKSDIIGMFNSVNNNHLKKGRTVIIGETSISYKNNPEERLKWIESYYGTAKQYGVPLVLWDNNRASDNNNPGEAHGQLNRSGLSWYYPEFIEKIMKVLEISNSGEVINPVIAAARTNGEKVVVTCSRKMAANNDFSGFTLYINGTEKAEAITSMSISDKEITLTLSPSATFTSNDLVNLSFDGDLQSDQGGVLVAIDKMSVKNQIPGGTTILNNCEGSEDPALASLGGGWYTYKNEASTISYNTQTGANGTEKSAHFTYTIGGTGDVYAGMGFSLANNSGSDFTGSTGFSFYYKGSASTLEIGVSAVTDYSYHFIEIPACNDWTKLEFEWEDVQSTNWGQGSGLNFSDDALYSQITLFQWKGVAGSGEFWVDEVVLIGLELIKAVNRDDLNALIVNANNTVNSASEDDYPATAFTDLRAAIETANAEAMNPEATQETINAAATALESALSKFKASKYADVAPLVAAITAAQKLANESTVGDKLGNYPQSAMDALWATIDDVQSIAETDKSELTQTEVSMAVSDLQKAVTAFKKAKITTITACGDIAGKAIASQKIFTADGCQVFEKRVGNWYIVLTTYTDGSQSSEKVYIEEN